MNSIHRAFDYLPPSVNNLYRSRHKGVYPTKSYKQFKERLSNDFSPLVPLIEEPIKVTVDFYLKGKRKRDLDNLLKACLDGFQGVIYKDDAQITNIVAQKIPSDIDRTVITFFYSGASYGDTLSTAHISDHMGDIESCPSIRGFLDSNSG